MKPKTPAFRACIKDRISRGHEAEEAEDLCRHVDAATSNYPLSIPKQPFDSTSETDESIASSPGPGWTSGGTNVGTDRVVKQDPNSVANAWAHAQKRQLTRADIAGWKEHAVRMGLDPDEMDAGWRTIMDRPEQIQSAAMATLKTVFGSEFTSKYQSETEAQDRAMKDILVRGKKPAGMTETVSWRGYSAPSMPPCTPPYMAPCDPPEGEMQPQNIQPWQTNKRRKEREKNQSKGRSFNNSSPDPKTTPPIVGPMGERISVNVVTAKAPEVGNARGQAQDANENPGFGFSTWSARMVFEMAQRLIGLYPLLKPEELLPLAVRKSGVQATELTPEDDRMLKIAIDWAQNGSAKTNIRTGGTPGGPYRSTADSHSTNPRGTFSLT